LHVFYYLDNEKIICNRSRVQRSARHKNGVSLNVKRGN